MKHWRVRRARPGDYDAIASVVDRWWGRSILVVLPRLFLDLFADTTWIAEDDTGLAGFVVGIFPSDLDRDAYIHFVGVRPDQRRNGLAGSLYELVEDEARRRGYRRISAITAPTNEVSIGFHRAHGFTVAAAVPDYNGPGRAMTVFHKML